MSKKNKKPFKESGIFKAIKSIAPEVLDTVTDVAATVYPPLGIVNNLVDKVLDKGEASDDQINTLLAAKEEYNAEYKDYLADVQDAREMYEKTGHSKADEIATSVINYNLPIIIALVIIMSIVIIKIEGPVASVISGLIGTAIGNLFQERNTVIGFFFGSSQGSKDKDK